MDILYYKQPTFFQKLKWYVKRNSKLRTIQLDHWALMVRIGDFYELDGELIRVATVNESEMTIEVK